MPLARGTPATGPAGSASSSAEVLTGALGRAGCGTRCGCAATPTATSLSQRLRPRPQGHPPIAARRRPQLAADSERARPHQRHSSARYPAGLHLHAFLQLGPELHVERDAVGKGSGLLQPGGAGGAVLGRRCRAAVLAHGDERRLLRPRHGLRGILPDHTDPEADLAGCDVVVDLQ